MVSMKSSSTFCFFGLIWFCASSLAQAQTDSTYEMQMLRGARKVSVHYTLAPGAGCDIDITSADATKQIIENLGRLGLEARSDISPSFVPDLSILVLLETHRANAEIPGELCNMLVKFEVFHQTTGYLRYSGAQPVLRVIAHRTVRYGSAPADKIASAISYYALRALNDFESAYQRANGDFH